MYSRFKTLQNFSQEDLDKLKESTVAVIGVGATGSVIAENLARHGVNLVLIDRDYLEENDLYSSNIYTQEDCKKALPKAQAAAEDLSEFTDVNFFVENLDSDTVKHVKHVDLIIDGTDNMETRFLIDEFSHKEGIPWIYTAALGEKGYSMFFNEECFNCVFEEVSAGTLGTCETEGIMREISGIAALKTSFKAVNYLTGKEVNEELEIIPLGRSLTVESEGCNVCKNQKFEKLDSNSKIGSVCGENKFQITRDVSDKAFTRIKDLGDLLAENDYLTRVKINGRSFTLFRSGRAIIEANDEDHAKALFSEIIGY